MLCGAFVITAVAVLKRSVKKERKVSKDCSPDSHSQSTFFNKRTYKKI